MTALRELLALAWLRVTVVAARLARRLRRSLGQLPPDRVERLRAAQERPSPTAEPRGPERWDPPVEGVDYSLADIDAELAARLAANGAALAERVAARHRPPGRPRRRTAAGIVAVGLVVLVGGGAATAALLHSTTGLPGIDSIIAGSDRDRQTPEGDFRPDPAPGASRPSPPLAVPFGHPEGPGRITVYVSAAGDVCRASVRVASPAAGDVGGLGCTTATAVAADLRRHGIAMVGVTFGPKTVMTALVRPGTEIVAVRGASGPAEVRRTRPWKPGGDLPAVETVVVFTPRGDALLEPSDYETPPMLSDYRFEIGLPGAARSTVRPWATARTARP